MILFEIKIPTEFEIHPPRREKIAACEDIYLRTGKLDRDLVISSDGFLIDGYVGYIVLCNHGVQEHPVVQSDQSFHPQPPKHYWKHLTTYVFGKHQDCDYEFVWRITPKTMDIQNLKPGNHILAGTRYGPMQVVVTRIETLAEPPISKSIKKVIRCFSD